jgi:hypothetical protein
MADMLLSPTKLQDMKKTLVESPPDLIVIEAKTSKLSIQPEDKLNKIIPLSPDEPSKVAHMENSLDPKYELTLIKFL